MSLGLAVSLPGATATKQTGRPSGPSMITDDQSTDALSIVQPEQGAKCRFPWMIPFFFARIAGLLAATLSIAMLARAAGDDSPVLARPFIALDNGLTDIKTAAEQAALLEKFGYDGICTRPAKATAELFDEMEKRGLKIKASYVVLPADKDATIPEAVATHIRMLKGKGTLIWLGVSKREPDEEAAVRLIRKVCDLAEAYGLEVALYPHVGELWTDTIGNCARLADQAERKNLGLSFTLCHFLAWQDATELEATLRAFGPRLKCVQINGCDALPPGKVDWSRLIQPLGEGSFDVSRVIRCLDEIGYQGPVILQCYQIKRPSRDHLAVSMQGWRNLQKTNNQTK
jgi:sugar phosphate isomerase/epimerase